jgi:uncharacterized tellurite resistance protein B-like protein
MREAKPHTALDLPIEARKDYLRVLAALAAVDRRVDAEELGILNELCEALAVTGTHRAEIIAFTRGVDEARVEAICAEFRESPLRYSLVTDLLYMSHSDSEYNLREREVIESIARFLGIDFRQLDRMEQFADGALRNRISRLPTDDQGDNIDTDRPANTAAGIAAVTVPLILITVLGGGLGSRAVAVALNELALRNGAIAGVVVAVTIATVVFFSTRMALGMLLRR